MSDERLIDLIYDAPYDDQLWMPLLGELADRSRASPANVLELNVIEGNGDGICFRTPSDILQVYRSEWTQANSLLLVDDLAEYSDAWTPTILRDSDWIDREQFERSAYLNEFLDPIEAAHNLTIRLSLDGPWLTTIGLGRPRRKGPFEDGDIAAVAPFHSHLIRASRLRRELALQQSQLDHLDTLLDTSPQALFFIDEHLKVVRCTVAAETLMRNGELLRLIDGRLRAVDPSAELALETALKAAFRSGPPSEPLVLTGRNGRSSLTLSVSRMGERAAAGFSRSRCLLVAATYASAPQSTPQFLLRERFGLTGAEARLTLELLAGARLRTLSESNAVSIHTLRNQLKSVFDKTGCSRQQDLIRMLAALDIPVAE
ncbi:helix-turn-helix transcriptional regulator [Sphingomonas sp. RT2P30]|uniref:helix-turn-helix transcriptional regulator n=1 Tax=Parasphingomonas halimpatiens TaxID=3096162 RepID=UPI002FCBB568